MSSLKYLTILGLSAAILGCDTHSPDSQVRDKIAQGKIAAATGDEAGRARAESTLNEAARVADASNASVAQAKTALAEVQYDAGIESLRESDHKELLASRIALQIAALAAQLGNSATLVQGYQKLEPKAANVEIEKRITEAKGAGDQPKWFTDGNITLPSQAAADAQVAKLQDEINKRQTQITDLESQRVASLDESERSSKVADATKGRDSVDAFKKASNSRKKAADFQTQIDLIKGSLVMLQKDLGIAQGQQQAVQTAIAELQEQTKTLDAGWKDVQTKIAGQVDLMKQIASATDATTQPSENTSAAGKSIAAKAALLAQAVKDAEAARQTAAEAIGNAAEQFAAAENAAGLANRDLTSIADAQHNLQDVVKIAQMLLSQQTFKLRQATAERMLAEMQMTKSAGLSARMKLRDMLSPTMQQAGLTMPPELNDATLNKQLADSLTEADSKFKDAAEHLADIIEGAGSNPVIESTKKAASIARIFVFYGQQQLAGLKGDQKAFAERGSAARDAVKAAADMQVNFPSLPGDLAAAIPPPPAPPAPASAPAETPAPTDTTPAAPAAAPAQ